MSEVTVIPHSATYVTDADGNFVFPALAGALPRWSKVATIGKKSTLLTVTAVAKSTAGIVDAVAVTSDAFVPGTVVHMYLVRRGGSILDADELYPSLHADAVHPMTLLESGDELWMRGVTASVRATFMIDSSFVLVDGHYPTARPPRRTIKDRPWRLRKVIGTDPAANTDWSISAPARAVWDIRALWATLVTDANAANRWIEIWHTLADTTLVHKVAVAAAAMVASTTTSHFFMFRWGTAAHTNGNNGYFIPCSETIISGKEVIKGATINRQVGDNWGPPSIEVLERIVEGYATEIIS